MRRRERISEKVEDPASYAVACCPTSTPQGRGAGSGLGVVPFGGPAGRAIGRADGRATDGSGCLRRGQRVRGRRLRLECADAAHPRRRATPRWSLPTTGAAAQMAASPAPIAALPVPRAIVWVGPPLLPRGWRSICVLVLWVAPPQVASSARSWLSAVMLPEQSGPVELATMVFVSVVVPMLMMPPVLPRVRYCRRGCCSSPSPCHSG